MPVRFGRNASVGIDEETVYGTAVPVTRWRPLVSESMIREIVRNPRSDLKGSSASAMRRGHFDSAEETGGSVAVIATYDNLGMWLKHLLGTVATTGAGPYTHTFTLAGDLPTGLSMEIVQGSLDSGAVQSEKFEGCKLTRGTFRVAAGEQARWEFDVLCETAAARGAASAPSFAAAETIVHYYDAGTLSFNAATYNLISLSLVVDNHLERRQQFGSKLTKEPKRSDFMSVSLEVVLDQSDALYTALLADTTGDVVVNFTSGTKQNNFTLQNAFLSRASDPIDSAGRVTQTVLWSGESNGTNEGLKIVLVNDNSTAIAN